MSNFNQAIKIFSDRSEMISLVHDQISPAEVRQGEKISAKILVQNEAGLIREETRVWRLSPLGIEVIETTALSQLKVGEVVEIEVQVGLHISSLCAQRVTWKYEENGLQLVGLRFCARENEKWHGVERRANKRWNCSAEFMPSGVAPNPGRFNDFVFFRVLDISSNGFRIMTSLRNKFLIPGMVLDASVSFPMVGQTRVKVKVANSHLYNENGKDVLSLGVEFVEKDKVARDIIGQYIFQFGPKTTIRELQAEKLKVIDAKKSIEFRYVRTSEEFNKVLDLRLKSYGSVGKLGADAGPSDVTDVFDTRSRIIIGLYRGEIIASARLIFNELEDQMEHEQFVSFPVEFPRKDEICEITRVCTHPDFRGSTLLLDLFAFIGLTVVQAKRKYILGCATDELLKLYKNIGFNITNISYSHKNLNDKKHTVFIGDVIRGLTGEGISPIYWNIVWGDLYQYLNDLNYVDRNPLVILRVGFYRLFGPLSKFLHSLKRRKKS